MALHVRDILRSKADTRVWGIEEQRPVLDAVKLLSEKSIGALLVFGAGGNSVESKITGILTERDYARKVILKNRSSSATHISEIMNSNVIYVTPDDSAESAMTTMTDNRIRYLPVLDGGDLLGIISMGDIVKSLVSDREFLIDQLLYYIAGSTNIDTEFVYKASVEHSPYRVI